jgi:two-component system sensor histidine kinase FlrB
MPVFTPKDHFKKLDYARTLPVCRVQSLSDLRTLHLSKQTNSVVSLDTETDRESLELAFRSFSEVSAQLADSYSHLQDQVSDLQQELLASNKEKMRASADKENLATRLEHLLDLLPGGVVVIDSLGNVEQCNPAAIEFLGEGLLGRCWLAVIEQCFSPQIDDGHEISLKDGRRLSIVTRSMDDGTPAGKKGQIILLTDQTHTRELQDQLSRRDRLSTMGKMVAYLAHQIRTPLSSAMLYGGHLKNPDLEEPRRGEFATRLLRQLRNVERQISDLLIFARGEETTSQEITVTDLFGRLQREIEVSETFSKVKINYHNLAVSAKLNCNPQTLISAILNLVNNSREACQDSVEGSNNESGQDVGQENKHFFKPVEVTIGAQVQRQKLIISITDNGPGIEPSSIGRVLEPFYSTRAKGTGLGLAVVQAVAKSLGGNLTLHSLEKGLRVKLILPVDGSI